MDKIKFAQLIAYLTRITQHNFDGWEIREVDQICQSAAPNSQEVIDLVRSLASDRKIEAIKAYRSLTGHGLKESKEAVETVMEKIPRVAA